MRSSVKLIDLPKIVDNRGNLTFLQNGAGLPFTPKRIFWTYNVPGGARRGGHAYKQQSELIIALNGAFEVVVKSTDGSTSSYRLDRGDKGLLLPPKTWRWMEGFSTNGLGLHLSNVDFDAEDYIYAFEDYKRITFAG